MYRSDSLPTSMGTPAGRSSESTPAPRTASCFGQTVFLLYETATDHSVPSRHIWLKMNRKRHFKLNIANRVSEVHISVPYFSLPVMESLSVPDNHLFINIVVLMQRHFSRKHGQGRASGTKDSPAGNVISSDSMFLEQGKLSSPKSRIFSSFPDIFPASPLPINSDCAVAIFANGGTVSEKRNFSTV